MTYRRTSRIGYNLPRHVAAFFTWPNYGTGPSNHEPHRVIDPNL